MEELKAWYLGEEIMWASLGALSTCLFHLMVNPGLPCFDKKKQQHKTDAGIKGLRKNPKHVCHSQSEWNWSYLLQITFLQPHNMTPLKAQALA